MLEDCNFQNTKKNYKKDTVWKFTDYSGLQINENCSWNVLPSAGFTEESVERVVSTADSFVAGHLTIGLDSMLQTVQFPTTVPNLNTGLANMD